MLDSGNNYFIKGRGSVLSRLLYVAQKLYFSGIFFEVLHNKYFKQCK